MNQASRLVNLACRVKQFTVSRSCWINGDNVYLNPYR